jgi:hypothetical protein
MDLKYDVKGSLNILIQMEIALGLWSVLHCLSNKIYNIFVLSIKNGAATKVIFRNTRCTINFIKRLNDASWLEINSEVKLHAIDVIVL